MSKTKPQKQLRRPYQALLDKQEEVNQALTELPGWTISTSLALFSPVPPPNLIRDELIKTGSGAALFHNSSIPWLSQPLNLAFVNTLHTIYGV
jgi:hypothetical protein